MAKLRPQMGHGRLHGVQERLGTVRIGSMAKESSLYHPSAKNLIVNCIERVLAWRNWCSNRDEINGKNDIIDLACTSQDLDGNGRSECTYDSPVECVSRHILAISCKDTTRQCWTDNVLEGLIATSVCQSNHDNIASPGKREYGDSL
jgi:hypothetical protein